MESYTSDRAKIPDSWKSGTSKGQESRGRVSEKLARAEILALQISGRMTLWGFIILDGQKSEILAFWVFERLKLHNLTAQIHAQQPLDELGQILVCSFILQLAVGHLLRVFA